jgi:hypothetical protein
VGSQGFSVFFARPALTRFRKHVLPISGLVLLAQVLFQAQPCSAHQELSMGGLRCAMQYLEGWVLGFQLHVLTPRTCMADWGSGSGCIDNMHSCKLGVYVLLVV